ncbi:flagellar hook-length control protein FliK [Pseudooceanicola algae]|uniref:Flagellar hook-length control protein-like C-terminal domain-containing protein n=1 Tax=Pseudooceanicola algae TaxID=1537215 RepID=A0A418SB10_9RHOB|nr:flagellar hook-length control protein FliK [Pseudooceanicola algae]QPM91301.1 hypothetical protein PSAL_025540 [Pseudooceanicola algae]
MNISHLSPGGVTPGAQDRSQVQGGGSTTGSPFDEVFAASAPEKPAQDPAADPQARAVKVAERGAASDPSDPDHATNGEMAAEGAGPDQNDQGDAGSVEQDPDTISRSERFSEVPSNKRDTVATGFVSTGAAGFLQGDEISVKSLHAAKVPAANADALGGPFRTSLVSQPAAQKAVAGSIHVEMSPLAGTAVTRSKAGLQVSVGAGTDLAGRAVPHPPNGTSQDISSGFAAFSGARAPSSLTKELSTPEIQRAPGSEHPITVQPHATRARNATDLARTRTATSGESAQMAPQTGPSKGGMKPGMVSHNFAALNGRLAGASEHAPIRGAGALQTVDQVARAERHLPLEDENTSPKSASVEGSRAISLEGQARERSTSAGAVIATGADRSVSTFSPTNNGQPSKGGDPAAPLPADQGLSESPRVAALAGDNDRRQVRDAVSDILQPGRKQPETQRGAASARVPTAERNSAQSTVPTAFIQPVSLQTTQPAVETFASSRLPTIDQGIGAGAGDPAGEPLTSADTRFAEALASEAARSTAPTPRAEAARADLARHIAAQLTSASQRLADGQSELRLNPEELGRVTLRLSTEDGHVMLHVTAERPETSDLMRRHIAMLEESYKALGYDRVEISISNGTAEGSSQGTGHGADQGPAGGQGSRDQSNSAQISSGGERPAPGAGRAPDATAPSERVDIRL